MGADRDCQPPPFGDRGATADRRATANAYAEWLRDNCASIPNWFPVDHAADLVFSTYPFHPTVFSVFERKWATLPKFQRTRGVLRMLALWAARAYADGYTQNRPDPLITLGTAPFEDSIVRTAIFEELGEPRLEAAVTADLAGDTSNAVRLDEEAADTIKRSRLHRKIWSAIFFESSGGQAATKEYATLPEVRLAVGEPGFDTGNVETMLDALVYGCYYLTQEGNRYRFSHKMDLNKRHADRVAAISTQTAKIVARVEEEIQSVFKDGPSIDRKYFPQSSSVIPNHPVLTLVVLDSERTWEEDSRPATEKFIETLIRQSGQSGRTCKSALIFAAAESSRQLTEQAKRLLAWEALDDEQESLDLDDSQTRQLGEQKRRAARDLREAVWNAYRHVIYLGKEGLRHMDLGLVHSSSSENGLPGLILSRLKQDGEIEPQPNPNYLVRNWPPARAQWPTKEARDSFYASPQFPRLADPDAIRRTVAAGVAEGLFGYAGKDADGNYIGLRYKRPTTDLDIEISDSVALLPKSVAESLVASGEKPPTEYPKSQPQPVEGHEGLTAEQSRAEEEQAITTTSDDRLHGLSWQGEVPPTKWMQFYTKVLSRFAVGSGLKLSVKFEIRPLDGIPKQKKSETEIALKDLGLGDKIDSLE